MTQETQSNATLVESRLEGCGSLLKQARDREFDGNPARITEMDALVAYLQVLGTMIDFTQYDEGYFAKFR